MAFSDPAARAGAVASAMHHANSTPVVASETDFK
jgi:hypothetical protein